MEKTLIKKPDSRLRGQPVNGRKDVGKVLISFEPEAKGMLFYPPVKMPRQPQGYLKCKQHDCL